jgi:hypothetical protein
MTPKWVNPIKSAIKEEFKTSFGKPFEWKSLIKIPKSANSPKTKFIDYIIVNRLEMVATIILTA